MPPMRTAPSPSRSFHDGHQPSPDGTCGTLTSRLCLKSPLTLPFSHVKPGERELEESLRDRFPCFETKPNHFDLNGHCHRLDIGQNMGSQPLRSGFPRQEVETPGDSYVVTWAYDGDARYPAWAPDDARLAFGGGGGISVIDVDGTNDERLRRGGGRPDWRRQP